MWDRNINKLCDCGELYESHILTTYVCVYGGKIKDYTALEAI
jgi:hypothetical protein